MNLALTLRNITRNKKNSIIVVILVTVITFLFFIGNTIMAQAGKSIRESFIESLTGDVVIQKKSEITMNLFTANTPVIDKYFSIPTLPSYNELMKIVAEENGISGYTSQVSGKAALVNQGHWVYLLLCGVEAGEYFSLFPGINLVEGRFLQSGEYGVMLTQDFIQRYENVTGEHLTVGSIVRLINFGFMGFKAREVPLVGIFSYKNPGQFMNDIAITDPQTARAINSIQLAGVNEAEINPNAMSLINTDMDDLFNDVFAPEDNVNESAFSENILRSYLQENKREENYENEGGDWSFILIRLDKGKSAASFISSINKKLEAYGAVAVNWRTAAGISAILVLMVQALFNAGLFLMSITGVIAAINIIIMSVFQRTREIGTLRAIGATNLYIRSLIFSENLFLALIAGFLGVFSGYVFLQWISGLGLVIPNELISSLLGGSALNIEFMPNIAGFSFIVALLLGFTASIYPVEYAVRIEPIEAVRRG